MPIKEHLKHHITSNKTSHCEINSRDIYDDDVGEVVALLNEMPNVTSLELGQTNITDDGIILLNNLLHITNLAVPRNDFGDRGAIALIRNEKFNSIDFHGNPGITDDIVTAIVNEAKQISLKVSDTSITSKVLQSINDKVDRNKQISQFNTAGTSTTYKARFFEEKKPEDEDRFTAAPVGAQDKQPISITIKS